MLNKKILIFYNQFVVTAIKNSMHWGYKIAMIAFGGAWLFWVAYTAVRFIKRRKHPKKVNPREIESDLQNYQM